MGSLRRRLGIAISAGAFVLTAIAGVVVVYERWQEALSALPEAIDLEAFRLAESTGLSLDDLPGDDGFALMLDDEGSELASVGDVGDELFDVLLFDIWAETTIQDLAVSTGLETDAGLVIATGVACTDTARCDTVVVGATEFSFWSFAGPRLGWVIGLATATAALTLVVVRWLIGRALEPVETMRQELTTITATDLDARISAPATGDEIERLGHTLDETIGRLGAAVAANERFVADAAHELRSPITGVRAAIEVEAAAGDRPLLDESIRELDRAGRLVDDLLVLARRQGDAAPSAEVDLDDVGRAAVAAFLVRHPDVEIDASFAPIRVRGDADALNRVVTNLLDNAARYGDGQIRIQVRQSANRAVLRVEDDGPGIPVADRARVFERFTRLDESRARATGGSGGGRARRREGVEAHGGTVAVEGPDGGGAHVVIELPTS
ncbi:MAG: HAMP domain-containing sensor histidine kinase [Actinomycetota bacterium]